MNYGNFSCYIFVVNGSAYILFTDLSANFIGHGSLVAHGNIVEKNDDADGESLDSEFDDSNGTAHEDN